MADQVINALSTKTAPETSDQLLILGTGEPQLIDYDKLADAILNKITSKNYALDAGQMTLLAALNKLNSDCSKTKVFTMQTEYGYLYFKKNVNVVGVYGAFENLPLDKTQIEITKDFKDFNPNYSYAVVDVKSSVSPYDTVGSLWLYPNGQTMKLYKPANLSRAYIVGNYVIQA
ncbi:hypothetical protein LI320_09605 [Blautia faecis]|uniref:hypothetical protein n=2 Tax=Blautia TaxID=572511 RepID=UPI001D081ABB|nr:hypothetical protein [Blautia faecis]MCB6329348.1 hypothetical protein [Blautia faecis]